MLLTRLSHLGRFSRHHLSPRFCYEGRQARRIATLGNQHLVVGKNVQEARRNNEPILVLESAVLTHGLPEPANKSLALELEDEVKSGRWTSAGVTGSSYKVTPATIGIVNGKLVVGLSEDEIEYLGTKSSSWPIKASRRDIPLAIAMSLSAGTTVSATMAVADCLNNSTDIPHVGRVEVFSTGGMGGVHMGGESSMDISADLFEFTQSPIGVVSSGFKSFLDTRRSLEYLETMGCTVASLRASEDLYEASLEDSMFQDQPQISDLHRKPWLESRSGHIFPGFFTQFNKEKALSPWQCQSVDEAARILRISLDASGELAISRRRAMLLACHIPTSFALDSKAESLYELAMQKIDQIEGRTDISGKEKTPLILNELNQSTGGATLNSNVKLLKNNARIGAHLAYEIARLNNRTGAILPPTSQSVHSNSDTAHSSAPKETSGGPSSKKGNPIVFGCTMIDMHVSTKIDQQFRSNPINSGVTFDGRPHLSLGGVGRNLATAMEYLGLAPTFVTSLAHDNLGQFALGELLKSGFESSRLKIEWFSGGSSCFALVLMDSLSGQCEYVIANMDAARAISQSTGAAYSRSIRTAPLIVLDANLSQAALQQLICVSHSHRVPVFIEPTDVACLRRLIGCLVAMEHNETRRPALSSILCISPNAIELLEMKRQLDVATGRVSAALQVAPISAPECTLEHLSRVAAELMADQLRYLKCLLVTLDKGGVLVAVRTSGRGESSHLDQMRLLPAGGRRIDDHEQVLLQHYAPPELIESPVSVSGAGDSFAAAFIGGLLNELTVDESVQLGFKAAALALRDKDTIPISIRELKFNSSVGR